MIKLYKFCIFLIYDNNPEEFNQTIESLMQMLGFEETRLIIIFDKMLYELDCRVIQKIDNIPAKNVKCLYNIKPTDSVQQIVSEISESEVFFFVSEGDTIDSNYLVYIDYFFEDNSEQCNVLLMPVVESDENQIPKNFTDLPYNGIRLLESDETSSSILPSSVKGVAILSSLVNNPSLVPSITQNGINIFYEVLLKAIIQKNCYGIIDTVKYFSNTKPESYINAELLKNLADYSMEVHGKLPLYLINLMNDYVDKQLCDPTKDFDNDIFALRAYIPSAFAEIDESSYSLRITDVRNYYADVEIIGTYVRPFSATETKLKISASNNALIEYDEQNGSINQWEQEINFKAILKLEHDELFLKFGVQALQGLETTDEIIDVEEFSELDKETGKIKNYIVSQKDGGLHIKKFAPRDYYKVSCIIPVYNGAEYLKEAIESVISQSIGFFVNIQILLINNGSTDNTEEICLEYAGRYPGNISYFYQNELGVSKARNKGLQHAVGEYISFLDADDKLPSNYMEAGIKYLKSNDTDIDMVAFPIEYFGKDSHLHRPSLNFRFARTTIIDVQTNFHYVQGSVCSTLIKRNAIGKVVFDERLNHSEDSEFVHKIILNKMKYGVLKEPTYQYRLREDYCSATQSKEHKLAWYTRNSIFGKALIDYSLETLDCVTQYTQSLLVHDLLDNIITEIPEDIAKCVNIPSIMDEISESLQYVDDDVIKTTPTLNYWFKCFLLKLKHHSVLLEKEDQIPVFYIGDSIFEPLEPQVYITSISENNNCIYMSGFYNLVSYDDIELVAYHNEQKYHSTITENRYKNIYFLGEAIHKTSIFDIQIPFDSEGTVDLYMQIKNDEKYPVKLEFPYGEKINKKTPSFCICKNVLILSTAKMNQMKLDYHTHEQISEIINASLKQIKKEEFKTDYSLIMKYLSMYPVMSKSRIWLFMDEPKSAKGNAEVLFSFCSKISDGIEKYFIIDKDTIDGISLENIGTVIQYGSDMHKLLYLYAEKVIVSNVLDEDYNPYARNKLYPIYNSIVKSELIYLPNETQTEDVSVRLNCFTRNIKLFATASEAERQYILSCAYGYNEKIVQASGLPKYDKLINEKQNKIIFMPSWREKLYPGENMFNLNFANTEYCKKISELLCDERLLEVMMEHEYEMCFVPHSKTFLQISDFDMYENVNIISPDFLRQNLFTSGSLLITDWMPVFDFAYMKKPIIYYRFAEDEVEIEITNNTMEFGETVSDNEILVDRIIEYIHNGCVMPEQYVQQVDNYFKYTDNNNCERIYTLLKGF